MVIIMVWHYNYEILLHYVHVSTKCSEVEVTTSQTGFGNQLKTIIAGAGVL